MLTALPCSRPSPPSMRPQYVDAYSMLIGDGTTLTLPLTLYMQRTPTIDVVNQPLGGYWTFGYKGAQDTGITWSSSTLSDSSLFSWNMFPQPLSPANFKVGLTAGSMSVYNTWTAFSNFQIVTLASMNTLSSWGSYWSSRNASIATGGICSVAHDITRTYPAGTTTATVAGLSNGVSYALSAVAVSSGGAVSSTPSTWNATLTPSVTLPVPGARLFVDANSLAVPINNSANATLPVAPLRVWPDISGANPAFGFEQDVTTRQPVVVAAGPNQPYQAVRFTGSADMEWNGEQTQFYLSAHGAANFSDHETTIFMMYQPKTPTVSYTSSAVLSNGLYYTESSGFHIYASSW
jgi:hypothetical protein